MANFYKLNPKQEEIVADYMRAIYNREDRPLYFHIVRRVRRLIDYYGETGYGNKPEAMDTVEYWLSHLKTYTNIIPKPDDTFDWSDKVGLLIFYFLLIKYYYVSNHFAWIGWIADFLFFINKILLRFESFRLDWLDC